MAKKILIYRMICNWETKEFSTMIELDKYVLRNKIFNFKVEIIKN